MILFLSHFVTVEIKSGFLMNHSYKMSLLQNTDHVNIVVYIHNISITTAVATAETQRSIWMVSIKISCCVVTGQVIDLILFSPFC